MSERQRRYRQRQRDGLIPLTIDAHEVNTVAALIERGFLEHETEDRKKIARALSKCWAWLSTPREKV